MFENQVSHLAKLCFDRITSKIAKRANSAWIHVYCYVKLTCIVRSTFPLQTGHVRHIGAHSEQHTRCVQGSSTYDTRLDLQIAQNTLCRSFWFSFCRITISEYKNKTIQRIYLTVNLTFEFDNTFKKKKINSPDKISNISSWRRV